jgi:hypothetical protein
MLHSAEGMADRIHKQRRLSEFFRRLLASPPSNSGTEAMKLISDTLNAVEDELSGVPFHPDLWQSDGRMYPPRSDSKRSVPGHADVVRFRSRGHNVFVGRNGAIRILAAATPPESGPVLFEKLGADGRPLPRLTKDTGDRS